MKKFVRELVYNVTFFPQVLFLTDEPETSDESGFKGGKTVYNNGRYDSAGFDAGTGIFPFHPNGALSPVFANTTESYQEWVSPVAPHSRSGVETQPMFMAAIEPSFKIPAGITANPQAFGRGANKGAQTPSEAMSYLNSEIPKFVKGLTVAQKLSPKPFTRVKLKPPFGTYTSAQTEVIVPALDALIGQAFNQHWLTSKFDSSSEPKLGEPMRMTPASEIPIYHVMATFNTVVPASFVKQVKALLYYDTATFLYEVSLTYLNADELGFIDEYNRALVTRQAAAGLGQPIPDLLPKPTDIEKLDEPLKAHAEEWWASYNEAQKNLRTEAYSQAELGALAVKLGLPASSSAQAVYDALQLASADKTAGTPWWKEVLGLVGVGGGKVWDAVKDWGPKELVGAYAGYEVVKSAKNSSIPTWLIAAGIGAVVLMIRK